MAMSRGISFCTVLVVVFITVPTVDCSHHDSDIADEVGEMRLHMQDIIKSQAAHQAGTDVVQENPYIEGDLILSYSAITTILTDFNNRKKRTLYNFDNYPANQWPSTNITVTLLYDFTDDQKDTIREGLADWSRDTCIHFHETDSENEALQSTPHIGFHTGTGCLSFTAMGENNMPQIIFLRDSCFHESGPGEIIHHVGHTLGLWHEHQRPDRDDYVNYLVENVRENEVSNFIILPAVLVDTQGHKYDYGSLMHFEGTRYSQNGDITLETKDNLYQQTIGQKVEISFWDKKKINTAYCASVCSASGLLCQNEGYLNPTDCSRCICPDGFGGVDCSELPATVGESVCGGERYLMGEPIYINSPNYWGQTPYPIHQTCSWRIQSPEGTTIRTTFVDEFEIYCRKNVAYHWVEIRYQEDQVTTGPRFCGTTRPDIDLRSSGNEVRVIFKSNYENENPIDIGVPYGERRGFRLRFDVLGLTFVTPADPCSDILCQNGGTCAASGTTAVCTCVPGYVGTNCETWNNPCDEADRCFNGGTCIASGGTSYRCECLSGYTGSNCSRIIDPCAVNPCFNGGECIASGTSFRCECLEGYTGTDCSMTDPCADADRCFNGGTCVNSGTSFRCECPVGFSGSDCSETEGCGGCGIPAGTSQVPCYETEMVMTTCTRYVTRQTTTGYFWWRRTATVTVCETYLCQQEQNVPYCCENAVLHYPHHASSAVCYGVGWGEWGDCSTSCGGCGNQRRYYYSSYSFGSRYGRVSRTRCIGEQIRDCGFEPCTACNQSEGRRGWGRGRPAHRLDSECQVPCCDGYRLNEAGDLCVEEDGSEVDRPFTTPFDYRTPEDMATATPPPFDP